jgi:hypothetical protein
MDLRRVVSTTVLTKLCAHFSTPTSLTVIVVTPTWLILAKDSLTFPVLNVGSTTGFSAMNVPATADLEVVSKVVMSTDHSKA